MAAPSNILVAMDSFKGTLSAAEACRAVAEAIAKICPQANCHSVPLADGGSGTTELFLQRHPGRRIVVPVLSPTSERITAPLALLDTGEAILEMATASGLSLIPESRRNPMKTTSFGFGQLLSRGFELAHRITVGLGDSGTVDGGLGALQALGLRLMGADGRELPAPFHPEDFRQIASLETTEMQRGKPLLVLSDVGNPLHGPNGAARVFGPQKGATPPMIEQLAAGLEHAYELIERATGRAVSSMSGAGAAGGMGAALLAFFDAEITSGADFLFERVGMADLLAVSDLVITGEGRFDRQSLMGKGPGRLVREAKAKAIPVLVLAGSVMWDDELRGILRQDRAISLIQAGDRVPAPEEAARLLFQTAADAVEKLLPRRG